MTRAAVQQRQPAALGATRSQLIAADELARTRRLGGTPISELVPRQRAVLVGVLRSVKFAPRQNVPTLQAVLFDGSGVINIIWLGRRQIPGIAPGRRLRLSARIADVDGQLTCYNPRYDLLPEGIE